MGLIYAGKIYEDISEAECGIEEIADWDDGVSLS